MFKLQKRQLLAWDIESYKNYFEIGFKRFDDGKFVYFEIFDYEDIHVDTFTPNIDRIKRILRNHTIVGFNSINYDGPMLALALSGAKPIELKKAGDKIIQRNLRPWQMRDLYGVDLPGYVDHIDLSEVAPGVKISLKTYGGRMHSRTLQDLPIEHDEIILPKDRQVIVPYNGNDLDTTIDLAKTLTAQIELRERMSVEYGIDMRSKSDAQVAEAVIRSQVERKKGQKVYRPEIPAGTTFKYRPPSFIEFKTEQMQKILEGIRKSVFEISGSDKILEPEFISKTIVRMGTSRYNMGIGGLHSMESCQAYVADDDYMLVDRDVTSYYPMVIIKCGLIPDQLGQDFVPIYSGIVVRRIAAKEAGDTVTADSLKITINGSFGKFGSKWSVLYAPKLLIQTTITGQLALLMLIEALEEDGIQVISGNTDGIVIRCRRDRAADLMHHIKWWETVTGFNTEETRYSAVYSRDVNNYIAIKEPDKDGKIKTKGKGVFADVGITKNPQAAICVTAVVNNLAHGIPIAKTVRECNDIRQFITVRNVSGGGSKVGGYSEPPEHDTQDELIALAGYVPVQVGKLKRFWGPNFNEEGHLTKGEAYKRAVRHFTEVTGKEYLGKVVRWYRSTETKTPLVNNKGDKVATSDCARPVMRLPDEFPSDVDKTWYIHQANSILSDIGAL